MNTDLIKRISVLFIIFAFTACSLAPRGKDPSLSLVDLQFDNISLFETSADVVVRVENPNPFPLQIDGASHDLFINGIEIGEGLSDQKIEIPRLSSATQRVKIRLSNLSVIRNIQDLVDKRNFDYRIESTLYIPHTLGLSSYKLSSTGKFSSL